MKTKVCFVLIYNHNHEANIDKLEKIYGDKFKSIFHLMPFYNGAKKNVIPCYQNSYFFCDFVRQGLPYFYDESFTHYVFVADDLILNPMLNENNIISMLCKQNMDAGFITEYNLLGLGWYWTLSVLNNLLNNHGCQFLKFLPPYEDACKRIEKHGLPSKGIPENFAKALLEKAKVADSYHLEISNNDYNEIRAKDYLLNGESIYPLLFGFSDFFILPSYKIKEICRYFGIFSSGNIFVEVAVPTSMLLCLDQVLSAKDTEFCTNILWNEDRERFREYYDADFNKFYKDFSEDLLYVHPVKLSQWNMKE